MRKLGRVEVETLRLDACAMHVAGTNLGAVAQQRRHIPQKLVAPRDGYWPSGSKNGIKLGIGQTDRRHGGGLLGLRDHC
jgi:hypothetical protein